MTNVIWKTKLEPKALQTIKIPHGAKILTAATQDGIPCVWYECDPEQPLLGRDIVTLGTGHTYEGDLGRYLGTCMVEGGLLVWHVFEAPYN